MTPRIWLTNICTAFVSVSCFAQVAINPQTVVQTAKQAFASDLSVSSITLSGQATRIAGAENDSGSITLTALADGSSSFELVFASESKSGNQSAFLSGPTCTWTGVDGIVHNTPAHNCAVPVAWFLPQVFLFSTQQTTNGTFTAEVDQGAQTVSLLWSPAQATAADSETAALLTAIGSYSIQFDQSTYLVSSLAYSTHPDNNAGTRIPVTVLYSDYRTVAGTAIPFHIQRYVNGVLSLDISLNNATVSH